jgi:hypothetical protein
MDWTDILKKAIHILRYRGEIIPINPIRFARRYEDDKLVLVGTLSVDYVHEKEFKDIAVKLKMSPDLVSSPVPFNIPKSDGDENSTTVFFFTDGAITFARPGRWCRYVYDLARKGELEIERARELDNKPIDDDDLFPEYPGL